MSGPQEVPAHDVEEVFVEVLHRGDLQLDLADKEVVGHDRRDRGEQADGRRDESLRDAGSDDGQRCVFVAVDGDERAHDAPHRAEQPDEGSGRTGGRQEGHEGFEAGQLVILGSPQRPVDVFARRRDQFLLAVVSHHF